MKYFTYELIAATNDWIDQTREELRLAEKRLGSAIEKYQHELESLKSRISGEAWNFFRYGRDERGLHDARLLSLRVGDGLNYKPDGASPFRLNRQRTSAIVEFLNYEQNLHYVFDLRGVNSVSSQLFVDEQLFAKSLGDLYIYELTAIDDQGLQLGFLFASGASVVIQFRRLVFRRRRITREYQLGEMYR
jgi:hypothetical protein